MTLKVIADEILRQPLIVPISISPGDPGRTHSLIGIVCSGAHSEPADNGVDSIGF
jgi:hypothetical protein